MMVRIVLPGVRNPDRGLSCVPTLLNAGVPNILKKPDIKIWHGVCEGASSHSRKEKDAMPIFFHSRTPLLCVGVGVVALGLARLAAAQPPPPPPAWGAPPPPASGPAQPGLVSGVVSHFLLTPRGELEGVLLADGTEVHTPPHLTDQLAAAVRIGDQVQAQGWRIGAINMIEAYTMTDLRTGQTVVNQGPPPPGSRPPPLPPGVPAPGAQVGTVVSRVQQPIYGPRGDINGALLEDGTEIKMPPHIAWQMGSLLQPGQQIAAQGFVLSTPYGRVMEVQALGPSPNQLTAIGPSAVFAPPPPPPPPR
jgi:hypothetical protein